MKKTELKKEKGITLISLVVTIVVMMILASITIVSVTGENGLLHKIKGARESSEMKVAKEELKAEILLNEVSNGSITDEKLLEILGDYGTVTYEEDRITIKGVIISTGEEILLSDIWSGVVVPTQNGQGGTGGSSDITSPVITSALSVEVEGDAVNVSVTAQDQESGYGKTEILYKQNSEENYQNATDITEGTLWATEGQTITAKITNIEEGTYNIKAKIYDASKNYIETEITVPIQSLEWNTAQNVCKPALSAGMVPVRWDGSSSWIVCSETDPLWYSYTTENKQWANIMLMDDLTTNEHNNASIKGMTRATLNSDLAGETVVTLGSMFVWVPRYAYKITSHLHTETDGAGTIEVAFINTQNKNGETTYSTTYPAQFTTGGGMGDFVVHPAFDYGEAHLPGIWVAKFQASNVEQVGYNGTDKEVKVLPGKKSWRDISINNSFTNCVEMNKIGNSYYLDTNDNVTDPHLIKNVEWGAVAYLTQSGYGINGEIRENTNIYRYTGFMGLATPYSSGGGASSTGNIYGIYDLNGGSYEYTAAYVDNQYTQTGGSRNTTIYGASLIAAESKYKDIYSGTTDSEYGVYNNELNKAPNKFGDAIWETSSQYSGTNSWYDSHSYALYTTHSFQRRGGIYSSGSAGLYDFSYAAGEADSDNGFRPTIAVLN